MPSNKIKYVGSKLNLRRTREGQTRSRVAAQHAETLLPWGVFFFLFPFPPPLTGTRQTYYATYVSSASNAAIERRSCSPLRGESVSNWTCFQFPIQIPKVRVMIRPLWRREDATHDTECWAKKASDETIGSRETSCLLPEWRPATQKEKKFPPPFFFSFSMLNPRLQPSVCEEPAGKQATRHLPSANLGGDWANIGSAV